MASFLFLDPMARLYTKNAAQLFQKYVENEQEPKYGLVFQLRYSD
jgi:hypothetical protein